MKGVITAIQRFSLQDGPGIRTTIFFKGCPLDCQWCSNPETQEMSLQLGLKDDHCFLEDCNLCVLVCKDQAIRKNGDGIWIDPKKCSSCGACIKECPESNVKIIGQKVTIHELTREVLKDNPFYKNSGGGVTLSGGEPLLQLRFCHQFLKKCKEYHLHTVVDTSAAVEWKAIKMVEPFTDLFYVDIKHVDQDIHKKYVGAGYELILSNIRTMAKEIPHEKVVIRIPFIPKVNGDKESISRIAYFIRSLDVMWPVQLLPYHRFGERKYRLIGREYGMKNTQLPTDGEIKKGQELYHRYDVATEVVR
jgi:pyruvate formate lyase activating enzyme